MSENPKIARETQKLEQDALIELYILDLTGQGGDIYRFHNQALQGDGELVFGGDTYSPLPFEAKGFTASPDDPPVPTITIGNVAGVITALLRDYDDLLGARVVRIRTFRKHLADGEDPDGEAMFGQDIFFVDRKNSENKMFVELALGSSLDVEGVKIPGRPVLTRCRWQFKDGINCPYAGPESTCGKALTDCAGFFGSTAVLPFGGYPGVSRLPLNL